MFASQANIARQIVTSIKCKSLEEILDLYNQYNIIVIDGAQFFPEIVEFSEKFANEGKVVYLVACDGTFKRTPFGRVHELLPRAEKVTKLSAKCKYCEDEASYTWRTVDNDEIELPGGEDICQPVCRNCYMELLSKKQNTESFQAIEVLAKFAHKFQTVHQE